MADTLVLLQLEHRTIVRLLALVEEQLEQLRSGEPVDLELLALVFEYFVGYPDACHHPKEDLVFRRLQKKDAAMAASLGDLLLDHETLGKLTAEVADLVASAVREAEAQTSELAPPLERFVSEYHRHLEAEEWHFFPTVTKTFDKDDWALIDFTMFDQEDPLYDESAESRYLELRRRIWEGSWRPDAGSE